MFARAKVFKFRGALSQVHAWVHNEAVCVQPYHQFIPKAKRRLNQRDTVPGRVTD